MFAAYSSRLPKVTLLYLKCVSVLLAGLGLCFLLCLFITASVAQGCAEQQEGGTNMFNALMKSLCALFSTPLLTQTHTDTHTHTRDAFTNESWCNGIKIGEHTDRQKERDG